MRGSHCAYAKTILSKINTVLEGYDTENDREKLEGYRVILRERFEIIKTLDAVILDATKEEEINDEIEEAGDFGKLIHGILVKCNTVLTLKEGTSDTNGNVPGPSSQSDVYKPKLPKLSLKKFYGESTSWSSWWDSFYSAVHANKSLSEIDKFSYLKRLLEGQASSAIAGLQLTAVNYTEAIDILRSRYGNKQIIISGYMDTLLKLPVATSFQDIRKIRNIYDKIESCVRGLQTMGIK